MSRQSGAFERGDQSVASLLKTAQIRRKLKNAEVGKSVMANPGGKGPVQMKTREQILSVVRLKKELDALGAGGSVKKAKAKVEKKVKEVPKEEEDSSSLSSTSAPESKTTTATRAAIKKSIVDSVGQSFGKKPTAPLKVPKVAKKKNWRKSRLPTVLLPNNLSLLVHNDPTALITVTHQSSKMDSLPTVVRPQSIERSSTESHLTTSIHSYHIPTLPSLPVDGLISISYASELTGEAIHHVLVGLGNGTLKGEIVHGNFGFEVVGGSMRVISQEEIEE